MESSTLTCTLPFPHQLAEALVNNFVHVIEVAWSKWTAASRSGEGLLELEKMVHKLMASDVNDLIVGFFLKSAVASEDVGDKARDLVKQRPYTRLQDSGQIVRVRMLGGTLCEVVAPYYLAREPRGPGRPKKVRRAAAGKGCYPHLEILGVYDRVSPALASLLASQVARSPIDEAGAYLREQGLSLNSKTIVRVTSGVAQRALSHRDFIVTNATSVLEGSLVAGLRIGIAVDGGRVRTRTYKGRRSRSTRRRKFNGDWKEPKVFVIYELDENGRKKRRDGFCLYGGTMGDADECFKILSAYLRSIGASKAAHVVILGDGARWIWDRVPDLLKNTGIPESKVTEVVDSYHVIQRLHTIAKSVSTWSEQQRESWVRQQFFRFKKGQSDAVLAACLDLQKGRRAKTIASLTGYFVRNIHRIDYPKCQRRSLPMGSGAVESGIRRIINLRLKGNGIFWGIDNVEELLHLRSQLLSGRWFEMIKNVSTPKENWTPYATRALCGLAA